MSYGLVAISFISKQNAKTREREEKRKTHRENRENYFPVTLFPFVTLKIIYSLGIYIACRFSKHWVNNELLFTLWISRKIKRRYNRIFSKQFDGSITGLFNWVVCSVNDYSIPVKFRIIICPGFRNAFHGECFDCLSKIFASRCFVLTSKQNILIAVFHPYEQKKIFN